MANPSPNTLTLTLTLTLTSPADRSSRHARQPRAALLSEVQCFRSASSSRSLWGSRGSRGRGRGTSRDRGMVRGGTRARDRARVRVRVTGWG